MFKPLPKSVLVPLGLTAVASITDAAIQKKPFGLGTATLVCLNEDLNDILKMFKFLKGAVLLILGVSEAVQNEAKEQKGKFLGTLLGTLCASLLGNMLAGKGVKRPKLSNIYGQGIMRAGEDIIRAGQNF